MFDLDVVSPSGFSCVACAFSVIAKKSLPSPTSQSFSSMFSSKSVKVYIYIIYLV